MKNEKKKKKESYSVFWYKKGDYGVRRVESMIRRKQKRYQKRKENYRYNHSSWSDSDGRMWQECEMGGSCEYPCTGDC